MKRSLKGLKGFLIVLFSVAFMAFFSGCGVKKEPVYIPVKCNAKIPQKPQNNGDFESKKALMIYFLEVESLLKSCVGE